MDTNILNELLGPFAMDTPPTREGFFAVTIGETAQVEMWFWDGKDWVDSDDGLGDTCAAELASGWYGRFQAPATGRYD